MMNLSVANTTPRDTKLVQAANELVNQVFYGTLLRQAREGQQATVVDGGSGEKAFQSQLDMEFVKRMSQKSSPVAESLINQLSGSARSYAVRTNIGA